MVGDDVAQRIVRLAAETEAGTQRLDGWGWAGRRQGGDGGGERGKGIAAGRLARGGGSAPAGDVEDGDQQIQRRARSV